MTSILYLNAYNLPPTTNSSCHILEDLSPRSLFEHGVQHLLGENQHPANPITANQYFTYKLYIPVGETYLSYADKIKNSHLLHAMRCYGAALCNEEKLSIAIQFTRFKKYTEVQDDLALARFRKGLDVGSLDETSQIQQAIRTWLTEDIST